MFRAQRRGGRARQGERVRRAAIHDERERLPGRRRHRALRPVPPHDRTEREKAQEKGKSKTRVPSLHRLRDRRNRTRSKRGAGRVAARRRAAFWETSRSATRRVRWSRARSPCRHVVLARRHGMALYGVRALDLAAKEPPAHLRASSTVTSRTCPQDAARFTGTRSSRASRETRPRSTTAHALRPGSSTSAPTGWATTRGSGSSACEFRGFNYVGDTQWLGGTVHREVPRRRRSARVHLDLRAESQRGDAHHAGARHDPASQP